MSSQELANTYVTIKFVTYKCTNVEWIYPTNLAKLTFLTDIEIIEIRLRARPVAAALDSSLKLITNIIDGQ